MSILREIAKTAFMNDSKFVFVREDDVGKLAGELSSLSWVREFPPNEELLREALVDGTFKYAGATVLLDSAA